MLKRMGASAPLFLTLALLIGLLPGCGGRSGDTGLASPEQEGAKRDSFTADLLLSYAPGGLSPELSFEMTELKGGTLRLSVLFQGGEFPIEGFGAKFSHSGSAWSPAEFTPAPLWGPDTLSVYGFCADGGFEFAVAPLSPIGEVGPGTVLGSVRLTRDVLRRVSAAVGPAPVDVELVKDDDGFTLTWSEDMPGDYNKDGMVNGLDLFPLASHFNEHSDYNGNTAEEPDNNCIDGNKDGELNGQDLFLISLNFDTRISSYNVYRKLDPAETFTKWNTEDIVPDRDLAAGVCDPLTSFVDEAPGAGHFSYYVTSYDSNTGQESDPSDVVEDDYYTTEPPEAPEDFTATDGDYQDRVEMSWTHPNEWKVENYYVYRSTDGVSNWTQIGTTTEKTYSDSTGPADVIVHYRVTAANHFHTEGDPSASDTGFRNPPPGVPAGFQALFDEYEDLVVLAWDANPEADILQYKVYKSDNETGPWQYLGATTSLVWYDSNVEDGVIYWYRISAEDDTSQEGDPTAALAAYIGNPDISQPTGLTATEGEFSTYVRLDWDDNPEVTLDHYTVYRSDKPNEDFAVLADDLTESTYDDYDVIEGQTWYYRVSAWDVQDDESALSEVVSGWPTNLAPPAPTNLAAADGEPVNYIEVTWDAVDIPDFKEYVLLRSTLPTTGFTPIVSGLTTTSYQDFGVITEQNYYYRATTIDTLDQSSVVSNTDLGYLGVDPPAKPTGLSASQGAFGGFVRIDWFDSPEGNFDHYILYRSDEEEGTYEEVTGATELTVSNYDDSTPIEGETYWYKVTAVNTADRESDFSDAASGWITDQTPAPPTGLAATQGTHDAKVVLTWNESTIPDFSHYDVYRSLVEGGDGTQLNSSDLDTETYEDFDVVEGQSYFYRVSVTDEGLHESSRSTEAEGSVADYDPAAPTNLDASDADYNARIVLEWDGVTEPDFDEYEIQRKEGSEGTYAQIATTEETDYADDDSVLQEGVDYYYRVRTVDTAGNTSTWSTEDSGNLINSPPPTPTGFSVTEDQLGYVGVSWDEVLVSDLKEYQLVRSQDPLINFQLITPNNFLNTSYQDTDVVEGQTYYYKVRAVDTFPYFSSYTDVDSGYTTDVAPSAPTGLTATEGDHAGKVTLDWDDNSESDLDHYEVYRSDTETGTYTQINASDVANSTYDDETVLEGSTYWYKVAAVDLNDLESDKSSADEGWPTDNAPGQVQGVLASDGTLEGEVYVEWNDLDIDDLQYYEIQRADTQSGTYSAIDTTTNLNYTDDDSALEEAETYWYKVRARDNADTWGALSLANAGSIKDVDPDAPTNLTATDGTVSDQVNLNWDDNDESDLDGYHVYRATSETGTYTRVTNSLLSDSDYSDTNVQEGTTYWYKVRAYDMQSNESEDSAVNSGYPQNTSPGAPTSLDASDGTYTDKVRITWTLNQEPDISHYKVYRSDTELGSYALRGQPTTSPWDDESSETGGPEEGFTYWYKIKAVDTGGLESGWSNTNTGSVENVPPSAPTGVTAADGDSTTEIEVDWNDNPLNDAVDHYEVYRAVGASDAAYGLIDDDVSDSFYEDTTANEGLTYYYKIKAIDSVDNSSGFSDYDAGSLIDSDPPAPTSLGASDGDYSAKVQVYWTSGGTPPDFDYFSVERSDTETGTYSEIETTTNTSIEDTDVDEGGKYWYRVRAYDDADNTSTYAGPVQGWPTNVAPPAPTDVSASDGTSTTDIDVTWTAPDIVDFDYYQVHRSLYTSGGYTQIGTTGTTSYTDSTGYDGITYHYRIKTVDEEGLISPLSGQDGGYLADSTPSTPTGLTATDDDYDDRIDLDWDDNPEGDIDHYNVLRSSSAEGTYSQIGSSGTSSYTDSAMAVNVTWYYKVQAEDTNSNVSSSSTYDDGIADPDPSVPTNISASDGDYETYVLVSWDTVDDVDVLNYSVYRATASDGTYSLLGTTTSSIWYDEQITVDTTYYYKVLSRDEAGQESALSVPDSGYAEDPPPSAPGDLSASQGDYEGEVHLSWSETDDGDLDHYDVYRSSSELGTYTKIGESESASYVDDDSALQEGVEYFYKVKAVDEADQESDFSDPAEGWIEDSIPAAPTGLVGTQGNYNGQVYLDWDDNSEYDFDYYEVYRSLSAYGTYGLRGTADTSDFTENVTNNIGYYYRVKAVDESGQKSDYSNYARSWGSDDPPPTPTGFDATDGLFADYVLLGWDSLPVGADLIEIYRSLSETSGYSLLTELDASYTEYEDTSANEGSLYWYKMRYKQTDNDYSLFCTPDSGYVTDTAPDVPTNVNATDGDYDSSVVITWDSGEEDDIDYFDVLRSTSESGTYSSIGTTSSQTWTDSTVTVETYYWYKITAVDENSNESDPGGPDSGYANPDPEQVENLSASDGQFDIYVLLNWDEVSDTDIDYYDVYRSPAEFGTYSWIGSTSNDYLYDGNVNNNTLYWYKVHAVDVFGAEGPFSDSDSGYAYDEPPLTPSGLTASDGDYAGWVEVDWNDNVEDDLAGYEVHRAADAAGPYSWLADTTLSAYDDSSAVEGTTYHYKVKAIDTNDNESPFSSSDSGYVTDYDPAQPQDLFATNGTYETKVALSWTALTPPDLDYYNIYRSDSETGSYTLLNTSSSAAYDDTSVSSGVYWYKVSGVDTAENEGPLSSPDSGYASDGAPAQPTGLSATDGTVSGQIDLDWDDNSESDLDHYDIFRSLTTGENYSKIDESTTSSYSDSSGLIEGITYYYVIVAVDDDDDESLQSSEDSGYLMNNDPGAPTGVTASDGTYDDYVLVDWNDNTETDLDYYNVYRATSSGGTYSLLEDTESSSYMDETAAQQTVYYYKITAVDTASNESVMSSWDDGYRDPPPGAPTNVSASDGAYPNFVKVSWDAPSDTDIDYYEVYSSETLNGTYSLIATIYNTTYYNDSSPDDYDVWYYKIKAVDEISQSSDFSGADGGWHNTLPPAPSSLSATDGTIVGEVEVTWTAAADHDDFLRYNVYRSESEVYGFSKIGDTTSTTYTDDTAVEGTIYYYKARTEDTGGALSDATNTDDGEVADGPPSAPTDVSATDGLVDKIRISWTENTEPDLDHYAVYRSTTSDGTYTFRDTTSNAYWDDIGVTLGTTYYFKVKAVDGDSNESDFSDYDDGYSDKKPLNPPNFEVSKGVTLADIELDWDSAGPGVYYDIFRSTEPGVLGSKIVNDQTTLGYTDNDVALVEGTIYFYTVYADYLGDELNMSNTQQDLGFWGDEIAPDYETKFGDSSYIAAPRRLISDGTRLYYTEIDIAGSIDSYLLDGTGFSTFSDDGTVDFVLPYGIGYDSDDDHLWICDQYNDDEFYEFTTTGTMIKHATYSSMEDIRGISVWNDGSTKSYIAVGHDGNAVEIFTQNDGATDVTYLTTLSSNIDSRVMDLCFAPDGDYLAVLTKQRLVVFTRSGDTFSYDTHWGQEGHDNGEFSTSLQGVFVDDSDYIYVTDSGNKRYQKFDTSGNWQMSWYVPELLNGLVTPMDMVVDPVSGKVYLLDSSLHNIVVLEGIEH